MSGLKIIKLPIKRWKEFRQIRLESLKNDPQAFGTTWGEENSKKDNYWKLELKSKLGVKLFFAVIDKKIVGLTGLKFAQHKNFSHIVKIVGVYVNPKFRGKGIAETLLKEVIRKAFLLKDIKKIKLSVNTSQKVAVSLYRKLGFKVYGKFKDEFKIGKKYYNGYVMELHKKPIL